jgi:hypothetical protein
MPIPQFQRITKTRKRRARRAPPTAALSLPDEANVEHSSGYRDSAFTADSARDAQGSENCALLQPAEGESSAADAPKEIPALLSPWRSRR